jgi:hypothetical protein
MRAAMEPARPKVVASEQRGTFDPALYGFARLFGDLELDGPLGLDLQDRGTLLHVARDEDVSGFEPHEFTAPQPAVDGNVEEGEVTDVVRYLETHADRPNVLGKKRPFLTDDPALVPGRGYWTNDRKLNCGHGFSSIRQAHPTPTVC